MSSDGVGSSSLSARNVKDWAGLRRPMETATAIVLKGRSNSPIEWFN
jgi:hypothetical protein